MPYYPIQSSFSAGEISPRVFAQEDSPVYAKGVELLRNFIALSQGPAKRRAAFRFIADLADVGAIDVNLGARVIPFDLSEQLTFILVLTPLRMDIYNLNGPAVDNNIVSDGDFFEELDAWLVLFTNAGRVVYNPDQRWYYFPRMMPDEIVLLKCFDSLTDGTARWTCHGAFNDPNTPAGAAPRESIEIRTLLFFD